MICLIIISISCSIPTLTAFGQETATTGEKVVIYFNANSKESFQDVIQGRIIDFIEIIE